MGYIVEQLASQLPLAISFPVEQTTHEPLEPMSTTHHITNHPSSSPTLAIHAKLPCEPRANSVSAEPLSSSPPAAHISASAGSSDTELCVDPSRSVTPESFPQLLTSTVSNEASLPTIFNFNLVVLPTSPMSDGLVHTSTTTLVPSRSTACPTATWRRVQHFIKVITNSPCIASALAALDISGHPSVGDQASPAAGGDNLRWTLSAMLALYLRSNAPTVSEESLLATLWTMESVSDARRSPATLVLGEYLKHLAAFDTEQAEKMSATWRESFCALRAAVVEAQIELLQNLEWSVRLTDGAILHCHKLLFGALPVQNVEGSSTAAVAAAAAAAEAEAWSAAAAASAAASTRTWRDPSGACADQVNALCACVTSQVNRIAVAEARKQSVAAAVQAIQYKRDASPTFSTDSDGSSYDSCAPLTSTKRLRRSGVSSERIYHHRFS